MEIEERVTKLETEVTGLQQSVVDLRQSVERGFTEMRQTMERGFSELRTAITEERAARERAFRWLFGAVMSVLGLTLGIMARSAGLF